MKATNTDPVRVPMEWTGLLYPQQKAVCRFLQDEALDMLAEDGEDHDLAKWLEAAAHHLGRTASAHERRRKKQRASGPGPLVVRLDSVTAGPWPPAFKEIVTDLRVNGKLSLSAAIKEAERRWYSEERNR